MVGWIILGVFSAGALLLMVSGRSHGMGCGMGSHQHGQERNPVEGGMGGHQHGQEKNPVEEGKERQQRSEGRGGGCCG